MKKHLLLVGSEPARLKTLPGFNLGEAWEMHFASTAQAALHLLRRTPIQAVIAGVSLPDNSGPLFLDTILQQHPAVGRFLLADLADRPAMLKCANTAHQFIAQPCDAAALSAALQRSATVETLFDSEAMRKLVARIKKIPSPPSSYYQIVRELQSHSASIDSIGAAVVQDLAITAKLLHLVNSAALGLRRQVSSPAEAVMYLGVETTKSLVLLAHTFSYFEGANIGASAVEALWRHSLATAQVAKAIARAEMAPMEQQEEAFTAGLLHDLGKLLLAANEPEQFQRAQILANQRGRPEWEAEQEVFGATHADLGGWLIAVWGMSLTMAEAILLHHYPARLLSKGFCSLTAVHVANVLCHGTAVRDGQGAPSAIDESYLASLGLQGRLDVWRQLAPTPNSADLEAA